MNEGLYVKSELFIREQDSFKISCKETILFFFFLKKCSKKEKKNLVFCKFVRIILKLISINLKENGQRSYVL